jgi:hypothetical protein
LDPASARGSGLDEVQSQRRARRDPSTCLG